MQSYLVKTKKKITRKEGDTGSMVFNVPIAIDLTGKDPLLQVRDENMTMILNKDTTSGASILGQVVTILLYQGDLVGKEGQYIYELQVYDVNETWTLGHGIFEVEKEYAIPV